MTLTGGGALANPVPGCRQDPDIWILGGGRQVWACCLIGLLGWAGHSLFFMHTGDIVLLLASHTVADTPVGEGKEEERQ